MYTRILVPLDGSKIGEAVLPYVEDIVSKLAPDVEKEVTLLQVLAPTVIPEVSGRAVEGLPYTEKQMEASREDAMKYLNQAGESLKSKGVTVTAKVVIGLPADEIVKAADEVGVNIIAMSTHGRSGISRWAFGSITDKVLRHEKSVPILVIKAPK